MAAIECADACRRTPHESLVAACSHARWLPHVRNVEIVFAVVVVINPTGTHSWSDIQHSRVLGHVRESSITVISVKILSPEVVHDVQIRPAVCIEVAPSAIKTVAVIVLLEAGGGRHVVERSIAVVAKKKIRRPVLGVVVRRGIPVLIKALVIAVETKINVEPSVAIVVPKGRTGKGPLRRLSETEGIRFQLKPSSSLILKEQRTCGAHDDKILMTIVVHVDKQCARCIIKYADSCGLRHILESPIPPVAIKSIRKAGRLAHIKVVKAIIVDIPNGNSMVTVNSDTASSVEHCPPVVGSTKHLFPVRWIPAERLGCYVHENGA